MSAVGLPKPGTEYGPCETDCQHIDCAETRKQAATICDLCPEPIGYDCPFYQRESWKILTHQLCMLKKIDEERREDRRAALTEITKADAEAQRAKAVRS